MPTDPIKHVVVLMLENHSFDQMLGALRPELPDLEGVDPANPGTNQDKDGKDYSQAVTTATSVQNDPMHELDNVLHQLENNNGNFVLDYSQTYPATTQAERQQIMAYFGPGSLPALHELARHFTICDHWYSSVPGPTWANRFFVHSGTCLGRVQMPEDLNDSLRHPDLYFGYDQTTIFDRLNEAGKSWRIYHGDIPQSLVLSHQRTIQSARHYARMGVFDSDAKGKEEHFPAYSFIEPSYYWPEQNDDHPPHTTLAAQTLLGNVYNALRQNEPLWNSTLLVVLYDEHGGFYDHMSPPTAVPPDRHSLPNFAFDRLGVRVPALLVSPWVERTIIKTEFDHTSLLKYLTEKWNLGPLTERVAKAKSFGSAIRTTGQPRTDTPSRVALPALAAAMKAMMAAGPEEPLNRHQKALIAFGEYLEREIKEPVGKPARSAAMMAGPPSQVETAKSRFEMFLAEQKANMKKVRITVAHNSSDPADDLRVAAKVRRDLWAHSPVELDPDSPVHGTHRDSNRNAYFEFATNYPDEVQRVLREYRHTKRAKMEIVKEEVGPECANCGNVAGPILPTVCPTCKFRDISSCPHCNQEVARQSYLQVSGDLFKCPLCRHRVRLHTHEPLFNAEGYYNQPLIVVEKAGD